MLSVTPSPQAPSPNLQSVFKGDLPPGDLDNITSELLTPHLILASSTGATPLILHTLCKSLLVDPGSSEGSWGDVQSPAGSDVSSANVWLNYPQGRHGCQQDTARLTSELPVTLSPSTGTQTCRHTHTDAHLGTRSETVLHIPIMHAWTEGHSHNSPLTFDSSFAIMNKSLWLCNKCV